MLRLNSRSLLNDLLRKLGLILPAEGVSDYIVGAVAEPHPHPGDYSIAPFDKRPIRHMGTRPNGWVRIFLGDLRLEYATGLIYSGVRPVFDSTDGLHADIPPTNPLAIFGRGARQVEKAIVLHSRYEGSYYHFLFDVVPKLEIIDRAGIAPAVPVIVTEDLAAKKFFVEATQLGLFGPRPVIVQGKKEIIAARELYVVRPDAYTERQLSFPAKRLGGIADPRGRDRLYISRSGVPGTSRQIVNEGDLVARLRELGFSLVDPGRYPLADQMARFARSSIVVGPHGAGLANILFRYGAPMALVEMINPAKKYHHHFFQISAHSGYFYRATLNTGERGDEQFASASADVDAVIAAVEEAIEWESSVYKGSIA
ncbi:MAG TPA: glycosyltransferase family 61 protein [Bauldia sp.]|nr:glycosyltransferase family 61 protein [Bauldia sp.]